MKLKFRGKIIREEIVRLIFVLIIILLGLIFATRKGFYLIKLVNVMILFILVTFCSIVLYYCFFIKIDY